jgi:hypothetical protein
MRVLVRSLVLAAAVGLLAGAQVHAQSPTIGFKLGPSFSKMSLDQDDDDQSWLTKFTGGGFVRFDMAAFALQPELMYVTKGGRWVEGNESAELRFDYIEVPVLFVLPLMAGPGVRPHLYAGPAFAFEVGCSVAVNAGGISGSVDCDADEEGVDRKKLDIGAMFGGGLSLPMGPGALLLEARYTLGLMDLSESEFGSLKHRSGAVLLGYSIPIGR